MRVVIPLAGTRGDIQPAVALGLELQSRGHSVALGVPPNLVDFATRAGLTATTFGPDVEKLYSSERGQKALAAGSTFKLMPMVARQMSEYADRMDGELIALAEGADVIVSTQLTEDRSQSIAEAHGIPQVTLHTFPSRRNGTYAFAGSVDHTKNLPAFLNKSTWVVAENIRRIAKAKNTTNNGVTVVLLDRPRHEPLAQEIRDAGARIKFISDGDVAGAIMAARPNTGVDLLLGIGGTPEGIITACAIKCIGGVIQGRLAPKDDEEKQRALDAGHDVNRVLTTNDLVRGDNCFFVATGITDGELLKGVRYRENGCTTSSLVMRSKSGTVRTIEAEHRLSKVAEYASEQYQ